MMTQDGINDVIMIISGFFSLADANFLNDIALDWGSLEISKTLLFCFCN